MKPAERVDDRIMAIVEEQTRLANGGDPMPQSELDELAKFIARGIGHEAPELRGKVLGRHITVSKWVAHGELEVRVTWRDVG